MTIDQLLQFAGRLHPMVLHAPIGMVIGLLAIEAVALVLRRPLARESRTTLVMLVAFTAVLSAVSGLLLHNEGASESALVQTHQWLGIAVASAAATMAVLQWRGRGLAYAAMLVVTAGLLVPTGHYGASMTHGIAFLTEPFAPKTERVALTSATEDVFVRSIKPILDSTCISCHGAERTKGKLALHTREAIERGGENGAILLAGLPSESEIIRRLRLPLDDDEHMPPPTKRQPSEAEIAAIEAWIAAGASFGTSTATVEALALPVAQTPAVAEGSLAPPPAPTQALASLRQKLIHVEPLARDATLLIVDVSAVATTFGDQDALLLLAPIREQIADLKLARSKITDATAALAATMPHLARLDLSATAISDDGVAALATAPALTELILSQTSLSERSVTTLSGMRSLKRLYLWKTGLADDAKQRIATALPLAIVDTGSIADAEILARESDVAPATAPATATATSSALVPVNTTCPVADKPVDPNFAIVYKGRVIGFCCKHCLAKFLDDPAPYVAKLP